MQHGGLDLCKKRTITFENKNNRLSTMFKCYQSFIYVNETHQDWTKNHILASMNSQQAFSIHYKSCLGGLGWSIYIYIYVKNEKAMHFILASTVFDSTAVNQCFLTDHKQTVYGVKNYSL